LQQKEGRQTELFVKTLQWGGDVVVVIIKARMHVVLKGNTAKELVEHVNEAERSILSKYPQCMENVFEPDFDNEHL